MLAFFPGSWCPEVGVSELSTTMASWLMSLVSLMTVMVFVTVTITCSFIVGLINNPSDGWIDGTAIVIAILLVAFVTATNNYKKELQFRSLRQVGRRFNCTSHPLVLCPLAIRNRT